MKFRYEYRTPDNVRHWDVIAATDREAAFSALKARGIRPGKLEPAPGLFNNLFGRGKRWLAIAALVALSAALAFYAFDAGKGERSLFDATERRQVIGDAAVIEKGIRTGWSDVFTAEGDRFLAGFAIPGVPVAVRSTTETSLRAALAAAVPPRDGDSVEARQVKAIVEGLKAEIRALLDSGWSVAEVGAALVKRQDTEISYYERAKRELETAAETLPEADLIALWEQRNTELRAMGIRLVALPEPQD